MTIFKRLLFLHIPTVHKMILIKKISSGQNNTLYQVDLELFVYTKNDIKSETVLQGIKEQHQLAVSLMIQTHSTAYHIIIHQYTYCSGMIEI